MQFINLFYLGFLTIKLTWYKLLFMQISYLWRQNVLRLLRPTGTDFSFTHLSKHSTYR